MNTHNFTRKFLPSNRGTSSHQIIKKRSKKYKKKNLKDDKRGFLEFIEMAVKSWAAVVISNDPFSRAVRPGSEHGIF